MKKLNKNYIYLRAKYILLAFFTILLVLSTTPLRASDMTMSLYYPSLSGEYDQIRFLPRAADLTNPCTIGTLYVNSAGLIQYCRNNSGVGAWGSLSDYWTQDGDNIYLTDSISNSNLNVGIGTKTPELKLTLLNDSGIIAKGTFGSGSVLPDGLGTGSRLIWYPRKAALRAGYVDNSTQWDINGSGLTMTGGQWDDANIGVYSTAFGKNSVAYGDYSVGGGDSNVASGKYSNVINGQKNIAFGDYSSISGGWSNVASGQYSTITGGIANQANATNYATVLGGAGNSAIALYATAGAGVNNSIVTPYSNINGGIWNRISPFIPGGPATGYSVIGGGKNNWTYNDFTVITGGQLNYTYAPYASIGGGTNNVIGSNANNIIGQSSRISGGETNHVTMSYDTISGGQNNAVYGIASTIGGGLSNTVNGGYAVVGGGARNTANGADSMIMGGSDNIAAGDYSWAEGRNVQLTAAASHTFAWGYSDAAPISIATADAFIIASGTVSGQPFNPSVGIRDTSPSGVMEINANNSADDFISITKASAGDILVIKNNGYIGVNKPTPSVGTYAMQFGNANNAFLSDVGIWTNGSSRKFKENIHPLSLITAQNTLDALYPVTFNYKVTPKQNTAGFIAEDVPEIVAMKGRQSLSAMDIIAVLTKVSQEQEELIKAQEEKITKIRDEIRTLKKNMGSLNDKNF